MIQAKGKFPQGKFKPIPTPEVTDLGDDGFLEFAKAELDSDWGGLDQLDKQDNVKEAQ